ncbi:Bug family tripartite tricarboxylate transporter substrate binding protein [Natrononativus amylolyticus]|uniref:Bug family tripartite tricarboxylate transporter substrate binding protein n=1 Tax=Natrononativus amylolyticus TaxID=2963434 RepID=UPI0020CDA65A|nr:tripartite tricarboxylate transporter substrate binding protein [Natrononativus amylolyticus]
MQRRKFVRNSSVGIVGALGLAGCLGSENGDEPEADDSETDDSDDENADDSDIDFPDSQLTWMIPWGEGGGTDTYARQIAPPLEDAIGQSIQIDNREGAGSLVGSEWLAMQDPDGYTFGTINSAGAHFTWRAAEVDDWHIEEDFEPISYIGGFGHTIIVNRDQAEEAGIEDFGSLRDAYEDGEISGFGNHGAGSDSHLTALLLREEYGLEYDTLVPYDGGGPMQEAVISGEVAAGTATNTSALSAEDSGEAIVLVNLTDLDLTTTWPDIDEITNYGDSLAWLQEHWLTQLAPAGTPEEERQVISEAVEQAVSAEEPQEWAEETGNILEYGDMEEAEELWTGTVETMEEEVDNAIGGFDEFLRMVEES